MDKKNKIDDLFREKLGNYEPEYVPEHWQMMKSALANIRSTPGNIGKSITNTIIIISAILLVSTGKITYIISERSRQDLLTLNQPALNVPSLNIPAGKGMNANHINGFTPSDLVKNDNNEPVAVNKNGNKRSAVKIENQYADKSTINKNFRKKSATVAKNSNVVPVTLPNISNEKLTSNDINVEEYPKNVSEPLDVKNYEVSNNTGDQNYVNGINIENTLINSTGEPEISSNNIADGSEKFLAGFSESEFQVPGNQERPDYSTVIDDYNAEKASKKDASPNRKQSHRNQNASNKKNLELPPDFKVGVVNNFALNPAYTGFNQRHTVKISTWVNKPLYKPGNGFDVPFEYSFAYDVNFGPKKNCGVGIGYKRFVGAAEGSMAVDLAFAYRFNIQRYHNLRVGISLSYYSSDINRNDLSFPDMIDVNHGFVYGTAEQIPVKTIRNAVDLGAGLWYSWKSLYAGFSATHLTSPKIGIISLNKIPREYLLSAGYNYKMTDDFSMLPAVELKYNEKLVNFSPSMLFTFKKWLLFGVEFRNVADAGLVLGFNIKDNVIINVHGGVPMNSILIKNFGIIDYTGVNVRLQFGTGGKK